MTNAEAQNVYKMLTINFSLLLCYFLTHLAWKFYMGLFMKCNILQYLFSNFHEKYIE